MEKEYYLNAEIPPQLQFEPSMSTWNSLSSSQEMNCITQQSSDCFLKSAWSSSADQYSQFESALRSIVSSPAAPSSAVSTDGFALSELIGKLGNIGHSPPPFAAAATAASPYMGNTTNANVNTNTNINSSSCYSTPLNSPPKLQMPILDRLVKDNAPHLGNLASFNPALPALSADPGFVERAAKFSWLGSRSFNGRTTQIGLGNAELPYRSSSLNGKLQRVSSSPSLKQAGSPVETKNLHQSHLEINHANGLAKLSGPNTNSNESSASEQVPSGETGAKPPVEFSYRKRKSSSKGKAKEGAPIQGVNATKGAEGEDDRSPKRSKPTETTANQNPGAKMKEEAEGNANCAVEDGQKEAKANQKPPEPPKDYIHVRARRGQATDSHSLAERVRREKISERMKLLQDLVPGCNKVTGKALMLDEIINYVQSLQRQVEFLSMKLASVNPRLEGDMNNLLSKDIYQQNGSLPPPTYPLDSSAPAFCSHQPQQSLQTHPNISKGAVSQCPVDPIGTTLCRNLGVQLPAVDGFGESLTQFPAFCEDDLHSIVQMGFNQNALKDPAFYTDGFPAPNSTSYMKVEL